MAEPERSQPRFNLLLSIWAGFLAFEAGALVVCIGLELDASRLITGWDGAMGWARFQHFILPICLVLTVPGALLRMMLGLMFQRPRRVALTTGAALGLAGAVFIIVADRMGAAGGDLGLAGWADRRLGLVAGRETLAGAAKPHRSARPLMMASRPNLARRPWGIRTPCDAENRQTKAP